MVLVSVQADRWSVFRVRSDSGVSTARIRPAESVDMTLLVVARCVVARAVAGTRAGRLVGGKDVAVWSSPMR